MKKLRIFLHALLMSTTALTQCPDYTVEYWYETFTYCGEEANEPFSTQTPCGIQNYYSSIAFTAGGEPVDITVNSNLNYTWHPGGPNLRAHIWIFDGCFGNPVWTTTTGACATGQSLLISGEVPAQNYDISLALPAGDYIIIFGYIGNPGSTQDLMGCVEISLGTLIFLDLPFGDESDSDNDESTESTIKRPRKYMHPRYGLYIVMPDGRAINSAFQQVTWKD